MLQMQINRAEASQNKQVLRTHGVSPVEILKIIKRRDGEVCYFDIADTPRHAFWVTSCVFPPTLIGLTCASFFPLPPALHRVFFVFLSLRVSHHTRCQFVVLSLRCQC